MSAKPVAQGSMTTSFALPEADRLALTTWGSMSLTSGDGDAIFQDSDILDLQETRVIVDYHHSLDEPWLEKFHGGVIQYAYASGVGESSRELFVGTEWDWNSMTPEVMLYWDIDERDGLYANGSLRGGFEVDEKTPGYWKVSLGLGTSRMNRSLYGDNHTGLSDLSGEVGATRQLNRNTTAHVFAVVSRVLANDDALDAASIDSLNALLGGGLSWQF